MATFRLLLEKYCEFVKGEFDLSQLFSITSADKLKVNRPAFPRHFLSSHGTTDLRKKFLSFSKSPAVYDLVKEQYFVPIGR